MAKVRVVIAGTVGKSVLIDDSVPSRVASLEASVRALGGAAVARHSALSGLQNGDDHPQYTMWQAAEIIVAPWNFTAEPSINGDLLTEFIQDKIGGILVDSTSIDFTYSDATPSITASVITANPSGLIGMAAANGTAATPLRSDGRHAIDPAIVPTWTGIHTFSPVSGSTTFNGVAGDNVATFVASTAAGNSFGPIITAGTTSGDRALLLRSSAAGNRTFLQVLGNGAVSFGNTTDNPTFTFLGSGVATFSAVPVVPNDSWAYAKIQNVSATNRVLGRISSGAGDIEELTGANLLTILSAAGLSAANPTGTIGLTAVNGSALTYPRSDSAPALSQGIIPTWTGTHTYTKAPSSSLTGAILVSTGIPIIGIQETGAGTDKTLWDITGFGGLLFRSSDDTGANGKNWLKVARGTGTAIASLAFGNATDNPAFSFLGTGVITAGGVYRGPTGSASAPFISLSGDTNTGVFSGGAGTLSISVGGVSYVGFGTTLASGVGSISALAPSNLTFSGNFMGAGTGTTIGSNTNLRLVASAASKETNIVFTDGAVWNSWIGALSDGALSFSTSGSGAVSERLRIATNGRSTFSGPVRLNGYTVATLPAGTVGDTAYVTDATAPVFGAAAVGGGAVVVPVYYTGAAWFVG